MNNFLCFWVVEDEVIVVEVGLRLEIYGICWLVWFVDGIGFIVIVNDEKDFGIVFN